MASQNGTFITRMNANYEAQAGEILFSTEPTDADLLAAFPEYHSTVATTEWKEYQTTAQAALDDSDKVFTRCGKAGVAFPAEWLARDNMLRAIIKSSSGDSSQPLPDYPRNADGSINYPAGT